MAGGEYRSIKKGSQSAIWRRWNYIGDRLIKMLLSPGRQAQDVVPMASETVPLSGWLDNRIFPMERTRNRAGGTPV
jgi:hypothetical protein